MSDDPRWAPPPVPEDDEDNDLTTPWASPLDAQVPDLPAPSRAPAGVGPAPGSPAGISAQAAPSQAAPSQAAPSQATPSQAAPSQATPSPAAPPEGKSNGRRNLLIGGCGGCLFILLSICCCSGYLLYLEEGVSYGDPGEELQRFPIVAGQPIAASVAWEGTGYASLRAYIDLGEDAAPGTRLEGTFDCREYATVEPRPVSESYFEGGDAPDGWVPMPSIFLYVRDGQTARCAGTLRSDPPTAMELVITERQRPSDWLSGF